MYTTFLDSSYIFSSQKNIVFTNFTNNFNENFNMESVGILPNSDFYHLNFSMLTINHKYQVDTESY